LSWPPPFRTTGQNAKILWWAGDQAAVQMRKMYRNDFLVQPFILRSVLWILETAFGNLAWVDHVEDREPRAAISLLRSLQETVEDDRYKIAIDKLIEKLKVPETIAADFGCIDPLAFPIIPIRSRKQAPDLVFRDTNDNPVRLSDDKGKLVLLTIGDSESGAEWIHPRIGRNGLALLEIWVDAGGRSKLDAYLGSPKVSRPGYPILLGSSDVVQAFGAGSLPITVLIDRSGRIAAFQSSDGAGADPLYCTYEAAVKALVAEP